MVSFFKSVGIASFVVAAADAASLDSRQTHEDASKPKPVVQVFKPSNASFVSFLNKANHGSNGTDLRTNLTSNSSAAAASSAYPKGVTNTTSRNASTSVRPAPNANYPNTTVVSSKKSSATRQPVLSTIYPNRTVPNHNSSRSAQPALSTIYPNSTSIVGHSNQTVTYKNLTSTEWTTYCPSCVESSTQLQSAAEETPAISNAPISVVNISTTAIYTTIATVISCPGVSAPCQTSTFALETTSAYSAGVPGVPEYTSVPAPAPAPTEPEATSASISQETSETYSSATAIPETPAETPIETTSSPSTTEAPEDTPAPSSSVSAVSTGAAYRSSVNTFAAAAIAVVIAMI